MQTILRFFLFLLMIPVASDAQQYSTLRTLKIKTGADTIRLDSFSIQPQSLRFITGKSDSSAYRFLPFDGLLIKNPGAQTSSDSITLKFRVLPYSFSEPFRNKDRRLSTAEERGVYNPFVFTPSLKDKNALQFKGLNKTGSISRGISVGNNQDLSVNSTLNLQLSGKLSPEIDISAAITDDNIPIQPDGNTQQLQDFDKVFIQLSDQKSKLIVGDFQITRPESYFMNFNKRLQGGSFSTTQSVVLIPDAKPAQVKAGLSVAVARGRFNRNNIQAVEGNQGPYRLRGANNEQFIIILSGSEKVYIDGRLLKRGQENDYVIDYNSAEITFTSRILMTKDLRIFVEFEYSDRNYARSLYHINTEVEQGKLTTRLNVFSEQDSKNQPLQQQLNEEQKEALRQAGDTLSQALVEAIDSVAFSSDVILYKRIDTSVAGFVYPQILVYSTNPDSAKFRAVFTNVGANNGDYVQLSSSANGRVYRWVAPLNGIPQGNFVAKAQLIPPTKKQLITVGTEYKLNKKARIFAEGAYSSFDQNTFSDQDSNDDQGYAFRVAAEHTAKLGKDSLPWTLVSTVSYEQVDKYFTPQERFRSVEFDRDWNLQKLSVERQSEYLPRLNLNLSQTGTGTVNYLFTSFIRENEFDANQHSLNADLNKWKTRINYNGSLTQSKGTTSDAFFYRHRGLASHDIWKLQIGYKDEYERNLLRGLPADTLLTTSYAFYDRQVFVQNLDTAKQKFNVFYRVRTDDGIRSNNLLNYARAENFGFSLDLAKGEKFSFRTITSVRNLFISDTLLSQQDPERTILNRVEISFRALKGSVVSTTFYEAGSGLETRKEFTYLEVQPGQGVYAWSDYNGNGIKELNEFEVSVFPDQARFIRIFTPTNDFIRVFSNQFNQVLNVKAPTDWNKSKGIKKQIARISTQSAWRLDSRTTANDIAKAYNPLRAGVDDPELITLNQTFRNSVFFNRNNAKFGFDLNWQTISTKALLNNGLESRENKFSNHRIRWNPGERFTIGLETRNGLKRSIAEFFNTRDYQIQYTELEPRVSYQPNAAFRLTLNYKYSIKRNDILYGGEKASGNTAGIDLKYNVADKGSLQAKFNFILIAFDGIQNTPVAFEMQEGLRSGENYTWGISYQRTLSNNMQLNVNYDGRKSPDVKTVHVGGVQVRLFF